MSHETRFADPYEVLTAEQRKTIQEFNSSTINHTVESYLSGKPNSFSDVPLSCVLQGVAGILPAQVHISLHHSGMTVSIGINMEDNSFPICGSTSAFVIRLLDQNTSVLVMSASIKTLPGYEGLGFGTGVTLVSDMIMPPIIELCKFRERHKYVLSEKFDTAQSFNNLVSRNRDGQGWSTSILTQLGYQPAGNFPDLLAIEAINPGTLVKRW